MRRLLAILTLGAALGAKCPAQGAHLAGTNAPLAVTISSDRVLEKNFLGFGVEWEYEGHNPDNNINDPVWTNHWPEMLKRIDFMRPAILRVMHKRQLSQLLGGA